jgi:hypothetical protein
MSVQPAALRKRLSSYVPYQPSGYGAYVDKVSGKTITFDFKKNADAQILVHNQHGGSAFAQFAFLRMRLHDRLADLLRERLRVIGQPFAALHVRNTDIETDYRDVVAALAEMDLPALFVASDSKQVVDEVRESLKKTAVYSFSNLPDNAGKPIHIDLPAEEAEQRNSDAILDLLTLALSRKLFICAARNAYKSKYSRYSLLARRLNRNRGILRHLLSRQDLQAYL